MQQTLSAQVERLQTVFTGIAAHRMQGVPLLHPGLRVQALGFAPEPEGLCALGVLVTPWFMNLMRLPLNVAQAQLLAPGQSAIRQMGEYRLSFLGAYEPDCGAYEMCSLASPMFEFADQEAAVATAREALACLRNPPPTPHPGRRRFLLGRGAEPFMQGRA